MNRPVDVRAIALAAMTEMRQKGESYEICARWISERVNDAIRIERETRQSEAIEFNNQP